MNIIYKIEAQDKASYKWTTNLYSQEEAARREFKILVDSKECRKIYLTRMLDNDGSFYNAFLMDFYEGHNRKKVYFVRVDRGVAQTYDTLEDCLKAFHQAVQKEAERQGIECHIEKRKRQTYVGPVFIKRGMIYEDQIQNHAYMFGI